MGRRRCDAGAGAFFQKALSQRDEFSFEVRGNVGLKMNETDTHLLCFSDLLIQISISLNVISISHS